MTSELPRNDPQFLAAYGRTVTELRAAARLQRKELAALADISYSYLSAIESGDRLPSDSVQTALARALKIHPAKLLAKVNGALTDPTEALTENFRGATMRRAVPRSGWTADYEPASSSPGINPSAGLAELRALLPGMAPEDIAIVVSMARRLSERGTVAPAQVAQSSERQFRGRRGRQLRTEAYLTFWRMYQAELARRGLAWGESRSPQPRSYYTTPAPLTGASFSASFARNRLLRHEMYINRGHRDANLELLSELEAHEELIRDAYGRDLKLDFENPGPERRAVRLAEYRDGHISRTDEYTEYVEWFVDRGIRLRRAIDAFNAARQSS